MTTTATATTQTLQEKIDALGPWFHNLHLTDADGTDVQTRPDCPFGDFPRFKWDEIKDTLPADLAGKTVLDIGCNAGFYTIELARRGADVTAIDLNPHYLTQAKFAVEHCGLSDKVTFHKMQVYDLARRPGWGFDVVIFMGVFYHLRYPLLGLDLVTRTLRPGGSMVFQTLTMPGDDGPEPADMEGLGFKDRDRLAEPGWPKMAFFERGFSGDPTNWWAASESGCESLLRSCRLKVTHRPGHEIFVATPDPDAYDAAPELRAAELASATGTDAADDADDADEPAGR